MDSYDITDTVTKSLIHGCTVKDLWEVTAGWLDKDQLHHLLRCCEPFITSRGQHCPNGRRCLGVHLDPGVVHRHREEVRCWMTRMEKDFNQFPNSMSFKVFIPEINEVCEVPIKNVAFTRGLFLQPEQRTKRGRGSGAINSLAATSCKLYAIHPARCSWGKLCNQAHISGRWLQSHCSAAKKWFSRAEKEVTEKVTLGVIGEVQIHDPTKKQSLRVPTHQIGETTRGLLQIVSDPSVHRLPSVCLLYLKGNCTAGQRCNQVHVKAEFMESVWSNAPQTVQTPPPPSTCKVNPDTQPTKTFSPLSLKDATIALPPSAGNEDEDLLDSCFARALDFPPTPPRQVVCSPTEQAKRSPFQALHENKENQPFSPHSTHCDPEGKTMGGRAISMDSFREVLW
eukprot:PhF_6_TR26061/c6_g1_i1/m.36737